MTKDCFNCRYDETPNNCPCSSCSEFEYFMPKTGLDCSNCKHGGKSISKEPCFSCKWEVPLDDSDTIYVPKYWEEV